jgi:hypothetical protein
VKWGIQALSAKNAQILGWLLFMLSVLGFILLSLRSSDGGPDGAGLFLAGGVLFLALLLQRPPR